MDRQQADDLAEIIRRDAPWLLNVVVQPAEEDSQGSASEEQAYVCRISGRDFEADIESFDFWVRMMEQLESEWWKLNPFPALLFVGQEKNVL